MKKMFALLNKLLHPPKWIRFLAPPIVFAALIGVFITKQNNSTPAYLLYGMSAYCLVLCVLPLPELVRKGKAVVMRWINSTEFGRKYREDLAFRGTVSICQGLIVDVFYIIFRIVVSIRYASVWFLSIAVYHLVLGLLRLYLLLNDCRRARIDEWKCYRRTAWLLFLLNVPMGGMIVLMVLTDSGYSYPGHITVGDVHVLYHDCLGRQSCKIPQVRQSDPVCGKGVEFYRRPDVGSDAANCNDCAILRRGQPFPENNKCGNRWGHLADCNPGCNIHAVPEFEKKEGEKAR